jgi:hypothetical protein
MARWACEGNAAEDCSSGYQRHKEDITRTAEQTDNADRRRRRMAVVIVVRGFNPQIAHGWKRQSLREVDDLPPW